MHIFLRTIALLLVSAGSFAQQENMYDFWRRLYEDPRNHGFVTSLLNARRESGFTGDLANDSPEAIIQLLADRGRYSHRFLKSATDYLEALSRNVNVRISSRHRPDPSRAEAGLRELQAELAASRSSFPLVNVEVAPFQSHSQVTTTTQPSSGTRPATNAGHPFPLLHPPGYTKNFTEPKVSSSLPIVSVPIPVASEGNNPPENYFTDEHLVRVENIPWKFEHPADAVGGTLPALNTGSKQVSSHGGVDLNSVVDGIVNFTLDLLGILGETAGSDENVVFSPVSITALLSLLTLATNGRTKQEIQTALGLPNLLTNDELHAQYKVILENLNHISPGITIKTSNRFFVADYINIFQSFISKADTYYNCSLSPEDFLGQPDATLVKINRWVENETQGKIKNFLVSPLEPTSKLVAVNTVYFKGDWKLPFDKAFTLPKKFNTGRDVIEVPMMVNVMEIPHYFSKKHNLDIVSLPYVGDDFSMYVILPKEGPQQRSIASVEAQLDIPTINELTNSMKTKQVSFAMPRMRLKMKKGLGGPLGRLNIRRLFTPDGDFSGLTEAPVQVNAFLHEAVLEVTEVGTVGAAASAVSLNRMGGNTLVHVNRPAVLFLRHRDTGLPVFWARLSRPEPI